MNDFDDDMTFQQLVDFTSQQAMPITEAWRLNADDEWIPNPAWVGALPPKPN
jgi:hypothetical protein